MTDTPTLDEAFDQASSELTSKEESPKETEEKPEESQEPEKESESPKEEPEPKAEESEEDKEEAFADKGELVGKTPEEMEEIYKNWQSSYTKKRQAERKELEDMRARLESLEKAPKEEKADDKPLSELTPEEYAIKVAEMAKTEVNTARNNAYIEAQEKSFFELDPRLSEDSPTYDKDLTDLVMMRLSNAREAHDAEGLPITQFDFLGKAKEYIEAFDSRIKNSNQAFLKRQSEIARTRSNDFAKESPKTSGAKSKPKVMDLDDAIESAFEK